MHNNHIHVVCKDHHITLSVKNLVLQHFPGRWAADSCWLCPLCEHRNQQGTLKCEYCVDQKICGFLAPLLPLQPKQEGLFFVCYIQ